MLVDRWEPVDYGEESLPHAKHELSSLRLSLDSGPGGRKKPSRGSKTRNYGCEVVHPTGEDVEAQLAIVTYPFCALPLRETGIRA